MYRRFYRLDGMPFENTPDPDFLYLSGHHGDVLASLVRGITSGKEWTLIAGAAGTGKTTLIQALLRELGSNFIVIPVTHPQTSYEGIVYDLSRHLSIHFIDRSNPVDAYARFKFRLAQVHKGGKRAVLIMDEAQLLDETCLTALRRLSDHVNENRLLIQFVLAGRQETSEALGKGALSSLSAVTCDLKAMEEEDVEAYVRHRLRVAGRQKPLFDPEALRLIREKSGGVPRVVNLICDNALLIGHALGFRKINAQIIQKAADGIDIGRPAMPFSFDEQMRHPGRTLLVALISLLVFFVIDGYVSKTDMTAPSISNVGQAPPIRNNGPEPRTFQASPELDDLSFLTNPAHHHLTARGRFAGDSQQAPKGSNIRTAPPRWSLSGPRRSSPPG